MSGRLVVTFDGQELFSRDVTRVDCSQTAAGKLTLNADCPAVTRFIHESPRRIQPDDVLTVGEYLKLTGADK